MALEAKEMVPVVGLGTSALRARVDAWRLRASICASRYALNMSTSPNTQLLAALRGVALHRRELNSECPTSPSGLDILERAAERALFRAAVIVPVPALVDRSMGLLALLPVDDIEDDELLKLWDAQVAAGVQSFAASGDAWSGPMVEQFEERCAVTFGIDACLVPKLLRYFHDESKWSRLGVLAAVQRSSLFSYVHREILAMPEEEDIDVQDPAVALRSLVSDVVNGE